MEYPGGHLSDQLTRTTVILTSLGLSTIALSLLIFSATLSIFMIAVTVLGMALGMYIPSSRTLVSDLYHQKRGRAFALQLMGGDIAGIIAAGAVVVFFSMTTWRSMFLPLLILSLFLLVLFQQLSREPIRVKIVEFEFRETIFRLLGNLEMRRLVIVYALFVVGSSGVTSFLPTFLIEVHDISFELASSAYALLFITGIVSKPVSGTLSDSFARPVISAGGLLIAVGGLSAIIFSPFRSAIIGGVVLFGLGQKAVTPPLQAYLMDEFRNDNMGGDFGGFRTIYKSVGSFGPFYVGLISTKIGFVMAFFTLLMLFLAAGIMMFALLE
jgi:predicted MFS family arabinose efflux permease